MFGVKKGGGRSLFRFLVHLCYIPQGGISRQSNRVAAVGRSGGGSGAGMLHRLAPDRTSATAALILASAAGAAHAAHLAGATVDVQLLDLRRYVSMPSGASLRRIQRWRASSPSAGPDECGSCPNPGVSGPAQRARRTWPAPRSTSNCSICAGTSPCPAAHPCGGSSCDFPKNLWLFGN